MNTSIDVSPLAAMARHRWHNRAQTILLLAGIGITPGLLGWLTAGPGMAVGAIIIVFVLVMLSPRASSRMVLRMYNARELSHREAPDLKAMVAELARRADLPHAPRLYYVPSRMLNAFATGHNSETAIAITDGLLRKLNSRELAAVLAHETAHIRHGDVKVMTLADAASRLVGAISQVGLLLAIALPLLGMASGRFHWWTIVVLFFAPTLTTLLQLGLSRTREFDADLGAVELTADPLGMVSALQKIDYTSRRWYEKLIGGSRVESAPSMLRTHPPTEERIERLMAMTSRASPARPMTHFDSMALVAQPYRHCRVQRPRWRLGGCWY